MRRWVGRVHDSNFILLLESYDQSDVRLIRTLSFATDTVCEAVANIVYEAVISDASNLLWTTETSVMNTINTLIAGSGNPAASFFFLHRLRIETLFTFLISEDNLNGRVRYDIYITMKKASIHPVLPSL